MRHRGLGRLNRAVSEIGCGMWGITGGEGGWTGADDGLGMRSPQEAVDREPTEWSQ